MRLIDSWTDETPEELAGLSHEEVLAQVTHLYNSDETWQQDGTPEEVTTRIERELDQ